MSCTVFLRCVGVELEGRTDAAWLAAKLKSVASACEANKSALVAEVIHTAVLGDEMLRRFGLSNRGEVGLSASRIGVPTGSDQAHVL